jgi:hypothetical protein
MNEMIEEVAIIGLLANEYFAHKAIVSSFLAIFIKLAISTTL